MIKKFKVLLIFLLFSLSNLNSADSKAMDQFKEKILGSVIGSGLSLIIFTPLIYFLIPKIRKKILLGKNLIKYDLTDEQKKHVYCVITEMGLDPSKINLYSEEGDNACVIDSHNMVIGKEILNTDNEGIFRDTIGHECSHILHNDTLRMSIIIALITAAIINGHTITSAIFNLITDRSQKETLAESLTLFLCILGVFPLITMYSRHIEMQADTTALETLKEYQGNLDYFMDSAYKIHKYQVYMNNLPFFQKLIAKTKYFIFHELLATHPTALKRMGNAFILHLKNQMQNLQKTA